MRLALVVMILAACEKTPRPKPYVVRQHCGGSDAYSESEIDLGAATHRDFTVHSGDDPIDIDWPIRPDEVTRVRSSIERVVSGGTWTPAPVAPDARSCTLTIELDGKRIFTLDNATADRMDAIGDLVQALRKHD